MNRLLTKPGGQPFWLEDIDFIQAAQSEPLEQLLLSLSGGQNCILSGCDVLYNGQILGGYILLNGEILELQQQALAKRAIYVSKYNSYGGERKMKNGSTFQCYEYAYARCTYDEGDTPILNYVDGQFVYTMPRLKELILKPEMITGASSGEEKLRIYRTGLGYKAVGRIIMPLSSERSLYFTWPSNIEKPTNIGRSYQMIDEGKLVRLDVDTERVTCKTVGWTPTSDREYVVEYEINWFPEYDR